VRLFTCVLTAASAPVRAGDAAAVAAAMTSEEEECRYVLELCREAQRAEERLCARHEAFHCGTEMFMRRKAASDAARVVEAKRGMTPTCFRDPACDFTEWARFGR